MSQKDVGVISRATLIPLGLVITLMGGVAWLSSVHSQGQFNTKAIEKLDVKLDQILDLTQKNRLDLETVRVKVEDMKKPLANTQANVKIVNAKMNQLAVKFLHKGDKVSSLFERDDTHAEFVTY